MTIPWWVFVIGAIVAVAVVGGLIFRKPIARALKGR